MGRETPGPTAKRVPAPVTQGQVHGRGHALAALRALTRGSSSAVDSLSSRAQGPLLYSRGMRAVLCCLLAIGLFACVSASPGHPKPLAAQRQVEPENLDQQISGQEAASKPGLMHKKLDVLVGEWQTTVARLAPDKSEVPGGSGITKITRLFEGRYLRWDAAMEIGTHQQETTGWLGYDRNVQEYQLCMITSFSSGMGIYRGQGDLAKEGIIFVYDQIDMKTGAHMRSRNRLKVLDADHFVIEDVDEDLIAHSRSHYRRVKPG